jgi:hypothetical protein
MNVLSNEEFAARVMALAQPDEPFTPTASYDPDGDCIEFLAKPDAFYAERVDDLVTVYYSQDTKEVIGSLIKGVSRFCSQIKERLPGFAIEIIDGRVKLFHIFLAKLWSSQLDPQTLQVRTYRKLIKVAEESKVETEFCPAA